VAREWNATHGKRATLFHLVLYGLARVLQRARAAQPVHGRAQTYQRKQVLLSFAVKKAMSDDAPLATVKEKFERDETFAQVVERTSGEVSGARVEAPSAMDKELSILLNCRASCSRS